MNLPDLQHERENAGQGPGDDVEGNGLVHVDALCAQIGKAKGQAQDEDYKGIKDAVLFFDGPFFHRAGAPSHSSRAFSTVVMVEPYMLRENTMDARENLVPER